MGKRFFIYLEKSVFPLNTSVDWYTYAPIMMYRDIKHVYEVVAHVDRARPLHGLKFHTFTDTMMDYKRISSLYENQSVCVLKVFVLNKTNSIKT